MTLSVDSLCNAGNGNPEDEYELPESSGHKVRIDSSGTVHYKSKKELRMEMRLKLSKILALSQKFMKSEKIFDMPESKVKKIDKPTICNLYEVKMKTSKLDDSQTRIRFYGTPEAIYRANLFYKPQPEKETLGKAYMLIRFPRGPSSPLCLGLPLSLSLRERDP